MRLTPVEQEIADCVLKGWGYCRIAQYRHISRWTARNVVHEIAAKLPPYGDLRGYSLVLYWLSIRSVEPPDDIAA